MGKKNSKPQTGAENPPGGSASWRGWVIGFLVTIVSALAGILYNKLDTDLENLRQDIRNMPIQMSEDATLRISAALSERLEPLAVGLARLEARVNTLHGPTLVSAVDYPVTLAAITTKPSDSDDPAIIVSFIDSKERVVSAIRLTELEDTASVNQRIVEEVRLRSFERGAIPIVLSRFTSEESTIEFPEYVETTASFILVGDHVPEFAQDVVASILREYGAEHVELYSNEVVVPEIRTLGDLVQALKEYRGQFQRLPAVT